MSGALAAAMWDGPPDAPVAAVLAHEGFGLTEFVRKQAAALASAGLAVVVPALYHRSGVLSYDYTDVAAATKAARALSVAEALDDLAEAAAAVGGQPQRPVALVGWCLGGMLAVAAVTETHREPAFASAVAYYPARIHAPGTARRPLIVHMGTADEFASDADWQLLDGLATEPTVSLFRYAGAVHGFANQDRPELYHLAYASSADARTLAALRRLHRVED
jgi:carboxymethylenebutenolidase